LTGPFKVESKTYTIKVPGEITTDLMDAAAINNRGVQYYNQGKLDEAFQEFNKAIQKDPEHIHAIYNHGLVHYKKGRYEQAISDCNQVLGLDPKYAKAYNVRGLVYAAMKRYQLAILDFANVVKFGQSSLGQKHTDVLWAMNRLAWIYATCPNPKLINGKKAVELATEACELTDWSNNYFIDTLAASCAANADFDSAVKWQRKAIQLLPDNNTRLQDSYKERLMLYESGKPYIEAVSE
jgi:tetratricopeptide (TPR) repeat protein